MLRQGLGLLVATGEEVAMLNLAFWSPFFIGDSLRVGLGGGGRMGLSRSYRG